MIIFDTNVILRYILQDNQEMANAFEAELKSNLGNCMIPVEVVAEMVYVLSKIYKIDRPAIAKTIEGIAKINANLLFNRDVVLHALHVYSTSKLDFVDCLLIGYAKIKNYSVFTFDNDLKKRL
jgi:predicted nucleic-acid-binding protein